MPVVTAQAPLPTSISLNKQVEAIMPPAEAEVPAVPEKEEESLSPRFAALARAQKEQRRRDIALKAREDAWKTKQAEYEKDYIPKSRLTSNPLEALNEAGFSYDQIAEMLLRQSEPASPAQSRMEQEIAKLRAEQENTQKKWQEQEELKVKQVENQIRNEAKLLIDSDPNFETIKEENAAEAVVLLIKRTFEETNVLMSVEEAAKRVEDHLVEDALKKANLKKVRAKLFPESQTQELKTQQSPQAKTQSQIPPTQQIKTLTNASTSSPSKPMSAQEKRQRAIMAFMGQLEG